MPERPASSGPLRSLPQPPSIAAASAPLSLPLLESLPQSSSSPSPILLTAPRPGQERAENLYVDAPLKTSTAGFPPPRKGPSNTARPLPEAKRSGGKPRLGPSTKSVIPGPDKSQRTLSSPLLFPAKGQPSDFGSSTLGNAPAGPASLGSFGAANDLDESIICRDCGRCRCAACRAVRKLPEKWLCGNKCHLSAETVVDTFSCMWLVKAFSYHCGKDSQEDAEDTSESNPCFCPSAPSSDCLLRWACVGVTSLCLPCLCCYLPLKGGAKCVEAAFQRVTSNGCRCVVPTVSGSQSGNLLPVPSASQGGQNGRVITAGPSLSLPSPSSSASSPGLSENRGLLA